MTEALYDRSVYGKHVKRKSQLQKVYETTQQPCNYKILFPFAQKKIHTLRSIPVRCNFAQIKYTMRIWI